MRGDTGEMPPSTEVPPPFSCSLWSGQRERKSMVSAMGEEGPERRSSMSSRPNCELVIIMVIVVVVGHEGDVRRC